jgi:hypothetical protein
VTAVEALKAATDDFKIEIGHIGFFKAVVSEVTRDPALTEEIRGLIERKNFAALGTLLDSVETGNRRGLEVLRRLPNLFGGQEVLEEAKRMAPNKEAAAILDAVGKILAELTRLGLSSYITLDFGMVHHINYYTGLIFRAISPGWAKVSCREGATTTLPPGSERTFRPPACHRRAGGAGSAGEKRKEEEVELRPDALIHYDDGFLKEPKGFPNVFRRRGGAA